jgi:hypothetical protein
MTILIGIVVIAVVDTTILAGRMIILIGTVAFAVGVITFIIENITVPGGDNKIPTGIIAIPIGNTAILLGISPTPLGISRFQVVAAVNPSVFDRELITETKQLLGVCPDLSGKLPKHLERLIC